MAALGGAWLMAATVFAQAPTILPAFPVAEGFGAPAKGGRGGFAGGE